MIDEIQSPIIRTAAKKHSCSECEDPINKGEKYHDACYVSCDGIYHWRQHLECKKYSDSRPDEYLDNFTDEGVPSLWSVWDGCQEDIRYGFTEWDRWMVAKFGGGK